MHSKSVLYKVNNKVNGEPVQGEVPLKQGDTIQISKHILVWANAEKDQAFESCLEPKEEDIQFNS